MLAPHEWVTDWHKELVLISWIFACQSEFCGVEQGADEEEERSFLYVFTGFQSNPKLSFSPSFNTEMIYLQATLSFSMIPVQGFCWQSVL